MISSTLLALGCGRTGPRAERAPDPPIVLVSIDTLRSDRLPVYGYEKVSTPAIDSFAADAILFEHAYSPAPLTLPAHASVLTGLDPPRHRVRDNAGYRLDARTLPYLPRMLRERGYRTGAAVSSWVMRGATGLQDGFEFYDDHIPITPGALPGGVQRSGTATLVAATDWLREVAGEPFFFFFHIYEPHVPYTPPAPFDVYPEPYDGEVAAADAVFGDLLTTLKTLGIYDQALVLLLSDHGEGLYDHGDLQHGLLLYREVLQVPLMLKLPGGERAGTRVARPVSLVDVKPTLLELLTGEVPDGLDGYSLLSTGDVPPNRIIYGETAFPLLHFGWSELHSLIDYPLHFIDGPDPELYDLENDPRERDNLVLSKRREAARLRRHLRTIDTRISDPLQENEETRRKLSALGYVGTTTGGPVEGSRIDPKSRVHILGDLQQAFTLYDDGAFVEAEQAFRDLLDENPGLVDAWEQLGHALTAQNRFEESLEPFRQAMRLSNGAPRIAGAIARALLRLGRLEEARSHAELAVEGHELSRDLLAQIAIRQGDLEAADGFVAKSVEGRGARLGPLLTLGELQFAQGRFEKALATLDRLLEEAGTRDVAPDSHELRGVHYLRGSVLARLGRLEDSAHAYREETLLFPSELSAYGSLALVSLMQRKPDDAAATLEQMLERFPTAAAHAEAVRTLRTAGDRASARRLLGQALANWPEDDQLLRLRSELQGTEPGSASSR